MLHAVHVASVLIIGAAASGSSGSTLEGRHATFIRTESSPAADQHPTVAGQEPLKPTAVTNIYHVVFLVLLVLTLMQALLTRPKVSEPLPQGFGKHQWTYLAVWAVAVSADWLQGPYVYALYQAYGYKPWEIAQLFVAGFGASMVFGTFAGTVADAWGRKRCAVAYCVLYGLSCLTKHSNVYRILLLGRILGGAATSILFSTFECWLVAEHRHRLKFNDCLLRYMFGLMYFVQYLTAIVSGVAAQLVVDAVPLTPIPGFKTLHCGGDTGPFDVSLLTLLIAIPMICFLWEENYGDRNATHRLVTCLTAAVKALTSSWSTALMGVVVSCFEGAMYAFVFNWTPALASQSLPPPHGLIFSAFMMACMIGSSIFTLTDPAISAVKVLLVVCFAGAVFLGIATTCMGQGTNGESSLKVIFLSFIAFEICVGAYFPAVGTLKSQVVPEEARAGVYNIYRMPLNAVVVCTLLSNLPLQWSFSVCCCFLTIAGSAIMVLQHGAGLKLRQ